MTFLRTHAPAGLRLLGEIDLARVSVLEQALAAVVGASSEELHLDLSGLTFIDGRGMRLLTRLIGGPGARCLLLYCPGHVTQAILRLPGWLTCRTLPYRTSKRLEPDLISSRGGLSTAGGVPTTAAARRTHSHRR
ncbi:MAG: STAS domain-containing protein [Actinobacteria bacterium]|nr:STAS domain-containing protein [Actinomycetota bacterium]